MVTVYITRYKGKELCVFKERMSFVLF